jgi:DNA invertase Pin-like site-specific DNA recombinase
MTQRAIFFLAVSTEAQASDDRDSLPEQRRQLDAAAAQFGWRVVDVIALPGQSRSHYTYAEMANEAAAAGMPDALRLFDHWQRRDFDVLAALNTTRLGRDQSILAEVIRRTIDAGATVYTVKDGFIDAQNQRMHIAMSGYATGAEMDEFKRRFQFGMNARVKRGLHPNHIPPTHLALRNGAGRVIAVEVDESKRRLFDDIFDLVVHERLALNRVPAALAERGHPPLNEWAVDRWLHNPYTWGHSFRRAHTAARARNWRWVFDEAQPLPDGVTIFRDTHPAVWTGTQAALLKAELARRIDRSLKRTITTTARYSGLCQCGECGRPMNYDGQHFTTLSGAVNRYLRCIGRHTSTCPNAVREDQLTADVHRLLEQVEQAGPGVLRPQGAAQEAERRAARLASIAGEIDAAEARARQLIRKQAAAPVSLAGLYDDELTALGAQIDALRAEQARLPAPVVTTPAQLEITARLRAGSAAWFWQQPDATQNQLLAILLGDYRLVVRRRRVVGIEPLTAKP